MLFNEGFGFEAILSKKVLPLDNKVFSGKFQL
jgi:hypothetical protein